MNPTGNVSPAGPLNGCHVPLPKPTTYQPVVRRNTSPFTDAAPGGPDPDAVARIQRGKRERRLALAAGLPYAGDFDRETRAAPFNVPKAAEIYAAGSSMRDTARAVGTCVETLRKYFRLAGVQIRPAKGIPPAAVFDLPRAIQLYGEGMTMREVGAAVGVSHTTLSKYFDQENVQRRPRSARGVR